MDDHTKEGQEPTDHTGSEASDASHGTLNPHGDAIPAKTGHGAGSEDKKGVAAPDGRPTTASVFPIDRNSSPPVSRADQSSVPSITITSPSGGQVLMANNVIITGQVDTLSYVKDPGLQTVSIQLDSEAPQAVNLGTFRPNIRLTWTKNLENCSLGNHTLTATATWLLLEAGIPSRVQATSAPPITFTVQDPATLTRQSSGTTATLDYDMEIRAQPANWVNKVEATSAAGQAWISLDHTDTVNYSGKVPLALINPAHFLTTNIIVRATDPAQQIQEPFPVLAIDSTPPEKVNWLKPVEGDEFEVPALNQTDKVTASVQVIVTVTDTGTTDPGSPGRIVSAGLDPATAMHVVVDGNVAAPVALSWIDQPSDPSQWEGYVSLVNAGLNEESHQLTLVLTDKASNSKSFGPLTVKVKGLAVVGTSEVDYLSDLVDFVGRRIHTGPNATDPSVTEDILQTTFHQPLVKLKALLQPGADPTLAQAAQRRINAVRGAIEVLRAFLKMTPDLQVPANAGTTYAATAYQALLAALGTSVEELKGTRDLSTPAAQAARQALARRLGFTTAQARGDELDQLLLTGTQVTESTLNSLFGLQPTEMADIEDPLTWTVTTSPTTPATTPKLLIWQQASLRAQWAAVDHPDAGGVGAPPDFRPPIIDPDIVTDGDLVVTTSPAPPNPALALRAARASWVTAKVQALQNARKSQSTAAAAFGALLAFVTAQGATIDLNKLGGDYDAGQDVSAELAAIPLDFPAFARLRVLSRLAAPSDATLTDDEWDDACAILVQVLKSRRFALPEPGQAGSVSWRDEEKAAGILLDPALCQVSALVPSDLPPWRASWTARQAWEERLVGRIDQLANLAAGLAAAVAASEQAALPGLRDALLAVAAQGWLPGSQAFATVPDAADELARRLCTDLKVGPQLTTTRLDRAVEALQGLLSAIDAGGGLDELKLPWAVQLPSAYNDIDKVFVELGSMGDYRSWTAAMNVFLFPENHLLPSIRPQDQLSSAFPNLLDQLDSEQYAALSEADARTLAWNYWTEEAPLIKVPSDLVNLLAMPSQNPPQVGRYPYTERLSAATLGSLHDLEPSGLGSGDGFPDGWFRELFFDLPLALGQALARAGQWRGALGWLRIIYDQTQSSTPTDRRQIFAGFAREGKSISPTRGDTWLDGLDPHTFATERQNNSYLRYTLMTIAGVLCDWADAEFAADTEESRTRARGLYLQAQDVLATKELYPESGKTNNPELIALLARPSQGLAKLRAGLNIAGMVRPLQGIADEGTSGVAIPPPATNYRYPTLVARAQQLCQLAAQIESSYLGSLEKKDQEKYQLLLAGQDLDVAGARAQIAGEQATAAKDQVDLTDKQIARAQTQSDTYAAWISAGLNAHEHEELDDLHDEKNYRGWAAQAQAAASTATGIAGVVQAVNATNPLDLFKGVVQAVQGFGDATASELNYQAEKSRINAQIAGIRASLDREMDQWNLAKTLADQDVAIGTQQKKIGNDQLTVANAEAALAVQVQQNAQDKLTFLQTKFSNAQLYTWMSGVLAGVYRYLLQQATAVARLAEQQLAFERQAPMSGYIKADYWAAPSSNGIPSTGTGGLAGSARLLQDITKLDDYALETNQRKVQLTQTFSLASVAPVALQQFRRTGVLPFAIPLGSYGTPGMYLATIRAVRISIAALVPPTQGIRATLAGGGASRIVIQDGAVFRPVTLARVPQTVLLTSPLNASGVFQVDLTPDLTLPWEGCGLDLPFELRMPKPINFFDYRTIADVQISFDYTALYSADYAAKVARDLPTTTTNTLTLSLRDFPDSWYQLLAQAQAVPPGGSAPLVAQWTLGVDDFPANLSNLRLRQIALYVLRDSPGPGENPKPTAFVINSLQLNGQPPPNQQGNSTTSATTVDDMVSTRNGSGASWNNVTGSVDGAGANPVGTWKLVLSADKDAVQAIASGAVQDLVLALTYDADLPAWPA